jgi:redox-sensitive bicupin YhaK (pirin superfamily)
VDIGPHPHIGLQTVTWLVDGELLHRDSVGSEQPVRPGQLNLMTAGRGVSHAEESTAGTGGSIAGIQLWVAQPEATRHGDPAFEHHHDLPEVALDGADATVLVGTLAAAESPARTDTELVGAELRLRPGVAAFALRPDFEHALVVLDGSLTLGEEPGRRIVPGELAYLGTGRDQLELAATEPCRTMLLGGTPFESQILMWWNFVARDRAEVEQATADWSAGSERFGETGSALPRFTAPPTPW